MPPQDTKDPLTDADVDLNTGREGAPTIDRSRMAEVTQGASASEMATREVVFDVAGLDVSYSGNLALKGVDIAVSKNYVTAFIGPSGCGKSTVLRCFNRMNDLIPGARSRAASPTTAHDLYGPERRPGRGAPADRDGLPEAEPVPEVDLRQHRLRPRGPRA